MNALSGFGTIPSLNLGAATTTGTTQYLGSAATLNTAVNLAGTTAAPSTPQARVR